MAAPGADADARRRRALSLSNPPPLAAHAC